MKYCRFLHQGHAAYGLIETVNGQASITRRLSEAPEITGTIADTPGQAMPPLPFEQAHLLAPVTPSKIVCVGRNYRAHVAELGSEMPAEPLIFLKPPSALLDPGKNIHRPR